MYVAQAGLQGPAWLPGLNKLQQIRVLAPRTEPTAAAAAAGPGGGRGGSGAGGPGSSRQAGQQQGKPDFASQLKRKGGAAASQAPEPMLGPEDFPTLQQSVKGKGSSSKQHVPGPAGVGPAAAAAAEKAAAGAASVGPSSSQGQQTGAEEQQQQLLAAWSTKSGAAVAGVAAGSSSEVAVAAAAGQVLGARTTCSDRRRSAPRQIPSAGLQLE